MSYLEIAFVAQLAFTGKTLFNCTACGHLFQSFMEFKLLKRSEKIMEIHFLIVNVRNFRPNGFKMISSKLRIELGVETKSLYPAAQSLSLSPYGPSEELAKALRFTHPGSSKRL